MAVSDASESSFGREHGRCHFYREAKCTEAGVGNSPTKPAKLQDKGVFEEEIAQTEYLMAVFRLRPKVMGTFQEEAFTLIVEQVMVYENRLEFQLKNGLILAEVYGKER